MFQHLQGRPAPPPPAPAGAAVRSERELLKTTQNRSEPLKIAQNHSEPLKTAQDRSESLRIAQIRFKLTQNHENPVNLESFWATYSRFCLLGGGTAAPGRQHARCRQPPERAELIRPH